MDRVITRLLHLEILQEVEQSADTLQPMDVMHIMGHLGSYFAQISLF